MYKDNLFDRAMIYYFSKVMSDQLGGERAIIVGRDCVVGTVHVHGWTGAPLLVCTLPAGMRVVCQPRFPLAFPSLSPARSSCMLTSCPWLAPPPATGIPFNGSWDDFVALSREIMRGRNSREQQETVAGVLAGLLPPQVGCSFGPCNTHAA